MNKKHRDLSSKMDGLERIWIQSILALLVIRIALFIYAHDPGRQAGRQAGLQGLE